MTNPPPAKPPREFWIVGPDDDTSSVFNINPGFNDQVHVIERSAYQSLAEELEQARKERDELLQRLADYEHETLTVKEALAEKMKAIGEYGLMMQQRDEAIRQADALANMIESLFCNPEGRASFEGSQGDKDIFNQGFEKFKAWRRGGSDE